MSRSSVVLLLAGFDEFIWDQCYAMEQSQRIDWQSRGREPGGLNWAGYWIEEVRRAMPNWLPAVVIAASASLLLTPAGMAQASTSSTSRSLHWVIPDVLPPGARLAILSGDPTGPGESSLELSMPNGYRIPPHFHPGYEHVEVKEGTLLVGMGDRVDPKQTRAMVAGDSATAPAGMHHFSIAKGPTLLLVTFNGPYTITYLHAEDVPQARVFPHGY